MVRILRSPKQQKKHRRLLFAKISLVVFGLAVLIGGPALLSHANFLKISQITVSGNVAIASGDIQEEVQKNLAGTYAKIFSKANIVIYPQSEIVANLTSSFSRFGSVNIERDSLQSLHVSVVERKPSALWCQTIEKNPCYFIDNKGLIFDTAGDFSENVYFVYVGNVVNDPINAQFLPPADFLKANAIISGIKNLGLIPVQFTHISDTSFEVGLKGGERIIISLTDDQAKIISNLESVLMDPSISIFQNKELSVSSIDVRYGNKIVLKKK
jgi:cell division septal protein FtsQ